MCKTSKLTSKNSTPHDLNMWQTPNSRHSPSGERQQQIHRKHSLEPTADKLAPPKPRNVLRRRPGVRDMHGHLCAHAALRAQRPRQIPAHKTGILKVQPLPVRAAALFLVLAGILGKAHQQALEQSTFALQFCLGQARCKTKQAVRRHALARPP